MDSLLPLHIFQNTQLNIGIYNYLCNWYLSPLMLWVRTALRGKCKALCDKVCQWLAAGRWFSPDSSSNKTDHHVITKKMLKMALNTIKPTKPNQLILLHICWSTKLIIVFYSKALISSISFRVFPFYRLNILVPIFTRNKEWIVSHVLLHFRFCRKNHSIYLAARTMK